MDLAERIDYDIIENVINIREDQEGIQVQVQLMGLSDALDCTWMPQTTLHEYAHVILKKFYLPSKENISSWINLGTVSSKTSDLTILWHYQMPNRRLHFLYWNCF